MELYFLERNVHTCARVGFCQMKNGFPSFLALSMKSHADLVMTSSKVVMLYFAFRKGRSCISCTSDMFSNGGSGPSSVTFCLPIAPNRGISVVSTVSVAKEWTRLRGPCS